MTPAGARDSGRSSFGRRVLSGLRTNTRAPILQVLKTSAAAVISWVLAAIIVGQPLPIFAAIAALLVVQPSVNQSVTKGLERSLGVIAGVVIATLAGFAFGDATWVILVIIVVSLLVAWALRLGPGSTNQIPISAMLVLALGAGEPHYAVDRIIETIIGAAVGLAINLLIVPPVTVGPARAAMDALVEHAAEVTESIAAAVRTPLGRPALEALLADARTLRGGRRAAGIGLDAAAESLSLNPRAAKHRSALERDRELLSMLVAATTQITAMARAVHDHGTDGLAESPFREPIARELDRTAHDLRLVGRQVAREAESSGRSVGSEPPTETTSIPALTAPLLVMTEPPRDWVLLGFLFEDIRRLHEGIVAFRDDEPPPA